MLYVPLLVYLPYCLLAVKLSGDSSVTPTMRRLWVGSSHLDRVACVPAVPQRDQKGHSCVEGV